LGGRKGIRPVKTEWWGAGVVVCLEQGADLHIAQLMPLLLTISVKSRLVLPFWYRLTWVVPEKRLLNGCVCVSQLQDLFEKCFSVCFLRVCFCAADDTAKNTKLYLYHEFSQHLAVNNLL